jgi:hypothetical protein
MVDSFAETVKKASYILGDSLPTGKNHLKYLADSLPGRLDSLPDTGQKPTWHPAESLIDT